MGFPVHYPGDLNNASFCLQVLHSEESRNDLRTVKNHRRQAASSRHALTQKAGSGAMLVFRLS
jgi:hypothetical protein